MSESTPDEIRDTLQDIRNLVGSIEAKIAFKDSNAPTDVSTEFSALNSELIRATQQFNNCPEVNGELMNVRVLIWGTFAHRKGICRCEKCLIDAMKLKNFNILYTRGDYEKHKASKLGGAANTLLVAAQQADIFVVSGLDNNLSNQVLALAIALRKPIYTNVKFDGLGRHYKVNTEIDIEYIAREHT